MISERIKRLAEEAGIKHRHNASTEIWGHDQNIKNFADLIIQECAEQLDIEYGNSTLTGIEAGLLLKKRFGVEDK